jgi:uncharacterized protein with PIN domain
VEVVWNYDDQEYSVKEKIGTQSIVMKAQLDDNYEEDDTLYFNIALAVYSKRKHMNRNEDNVLITGKNPLETFVVARRMFEELQSAVLDSFLNQANIVIYVHWVDSRRRDTYYKALKRYGYDWGRVQKRKAILRRFDKGDYEGAYGGI